MQQRWVGDKVGGSSPAVLPPFITWIEWSNVVLWFVTDWSKTGRTHPIDVGFSKNGGTENRWFRRENPIYKWMMTGGTPILVNHHDVAVYCKNCEADWATEDWEESWEVGARYVQNELLLTRA